jgi:hypothetical protein
MEALTLPIIFKAFGSTLLFYAVFYALMLAVIALLLRLTMRARSDGTRDSAPFRTAEGKARLEEGLVEFFARSHVSATTLRVLAAQRKPIGFKALMDEVSVANALRRVDADIPPSAVRAVLFILLATGLARMRRHGLVITPLGQEVRRRMRLRRAPASAVSMQHAHASRGRQTTPPRPSPARSRPRAPESFRLAR